MPKHAKRSDWKTREPPQAREPLRYECVFNDADAERLCDGLVPQSMEDKWFVYSEDGWLYLHRSWTGYLVYWLKLDGCPAGVRAVESWVNRDASQYRETDVAYDRALLDFLLHGLILGHDVPFPQRPHDGSSGLPGIVQHHVAGRAFPEAVFRDGESEDDDNEDGMAPHDP